MPGSQQNRDPEQPAPLRHACDACGGSCQGVIIAFMGEGEAQRVRALGEELQVADPVIEGRLRLEDGHCVFLGQDHLCRIHGAFGMDAKPTVCKQFPMVALRANGVLRVGIDPACYASFSTSATGPLVASGSLVASTSTLHGRQAEFEQKLLQLCDLEHMRVATIASWLAGCQPDSASRLPDGLEQRVVERAREADLGRWLRDNPVGQAIRASLVPVLDDGTLGEPSRWDDMEDDADAWAVEAMRRVIYLRLCSEIPTLPGTVLLLVAGAILCGRSHPEADAFARAYAGWLRAIRFRQFWTRFVPTSAAMQHLLRG